MVLEPIRGNIKSERALLTRIFRNMKKLVPILIACFLVPILACSNDTQPTSQTPIVFVTPDSGPTTDIVPTDVPQPATNDTAEQDIGTQPDESSADIVSQEDVKTLEPDINQPQEDIQEEVNAGSGDPDVPCRALAIP